MIACTVLETYRLGDTSACTVPAPQTWLAEMLGKSLSTRDPEPVTAGQLIDFGFNGWAPGSDVTVTVRSEPVNVGTFTADTTGTVRGGFVMPSVAPGVHRVIFDGVTGAGQPQQVEVLVEIDGQPVIGDMIGVFETGFAPFESVDVHYMDVDYGSFIADVNSAVFFSSLYLPTLRSPLSRPATGTDSGEQLVEEVPA
ncbi:MAG: hypothetical protein R2706_03505 [Acidimicrobiales bacterium]